MPFIDGKASNSGRCCRYLCKIIWKCANGWERTCYAMKNNRMNTNENTNHRSCCYFCFQLNLLPLVCFSSVQAYNGLLGHCKRKCKWKLTTICLCIELRNWRPIPNLGEPKTPAKLTQNKPLSQVTSRDLLLLVAQLFNQLAFCCRQYERGLHGLLWKCEKDLQKLESFCNSSKSLTIIIICYRKTTTTTRITNANWIRQAHEFTIQIA